MCDNTELEFYVTIKGKKVPCSREVYLAIKQPGRKENKRQQRGQRPFINGKRCQEDCTNCPHYNGKTCSLTPEYSLEQLSEESEFEVASKDTVEDTISVQLTLKEMYKELEGENECCKTIFSLMIQEYKQRDIAEELSLADGTVTYYIKKIRKRLERFNV